MPMQRSTDVQTKEKDDSMESFFFAETMKYLYLLFAPDAWGFGYPKGLVRCCAWGLLWAL